MNSWKRSNMRFDGKWFLPRFHQPEIANTRTKGTGATREDITAVGSLFNGMAIFIIHPSKRATPQTVSIRIRSEQPRIFIPRAEGFGISSQNITIVRRLRYIIARF